MTERARTQSIADFAIEVSQRVKNLLVVLDHRIGRAYSNPVDFGSDECRGIRSCLPLCHVSQLSDDLTRAVTAFEMAALRSSTDLLNVGFQHVRVCCDVLAADDEFAQSFNMGMSFREDERNAHVAAGRRVVWEMHALLVSVLLMTPRKLCAPAIAPADEAKIAADWAEREVKFDKLVALQDRISQRMKERTS